MSTQYTPGAVVTVGTLEVGNTIFLRERRGVGVPVPITPATVTALTPLPDGRVRVHVRNVNGAASVPAASLGDLPVSREFRLAVAAA
ncbi:hypothetical protein [Microbacterium terrisoli]|uniref:hypothetical protein n=1 Tax=Microbacterium terrisoli TaxID=3242192 RepID=UPI0028051E3C|nr:hypothetical protein [Microbacterium protaetiae]